jgi:hypothetical protein
MNMLLTKIDNYQQLRLPNFLEVIRAPDHKLNLEVNEFIGPKPKRAHEEESRQNVELTKRRRLVM